MRIQNEKGIAHLALILCVVALLAVVGFIVFQALGKRSENKHNGGDDKNGVSAASWEWDGQKWAAQGTAPACPEPLTIQSPVEVSKADSILYPGQTRSNDYKSHGGFHFTQADNAVSVVAPLDAQLVEGSRYIEQGETQVYFIFINPCGVMYRLDHLLGLEPKFQAVADQLPPAKPDDSRTTKLANPVSVKKGEKIATEVGFKNTNNVSFDFGLYDLRKPNGFALSGGQDNAQFNAYGLCWLNNLTASDAQIVKNLPATDAQSGKTSDYCK